MVFFAYIRVKWERPEKPDTGYGAVAYWECWLGVQRDTERETLRYAERHKGERQRDRETYTLRQGEMEGGRDSQEGGTTRDTQRHSKGERDTER